MGQGKGRGKALWEQVERIPKWKVFYLQRIPWTIDVQEGSCKEIKKTKRSRFFFFFPFLWYFLFCEVNEVSNQRTKTASAVINCITKTVLGLKLKLNSEPNTDNSENCWKFFFFLRPFLRPSHFSNTVLI